MIDVLKGLKQAFQSLDVFDETAIENAIKSCAESNGLNAGKLIQPLRVALTGKPVGPGIFETLILLGKEKVIQRLEDAILMLDNRRENNEILS